MDNRKRHDIPKDWKTYFAGLSRPRYSLDGKINLTLHYYKDVTRAEILDYEEKTNPAEIYKQAQKTEAFEILQNGLHRSTKVLKIACEKDKTPEKLMIAHGYDPIQWELVSSSQKAWNTYSKLDKIHDLFSSTITVKPISFLTKNLIKEVYDSLKPKPFTVTKSLIDGDCLLEIPIVDVHLSKLCWDKETGNDYDSDIAVSRYKYVISEIVNEAKHYPIERIVFPIGQDFFNSDNDKGSTNKGTLQSMDSRWQKMYFLGCQLIISAIETLKSIAPLDIMYVPGNHDFTMSYFLLLNTSAWYKDDPNVNIDISPAYRKYYQYGQCMIGYSHGEENKKNLPLLMQSEAPEIWGNTKFRELHLGHLHSEQIPRSPEESELAGFKIRRISTITGTDDWHTSMGYVGTVKQAQAFIWHKSKGLKNIINVVIE
jgi:hypothetical protein